MKLLPEENPGLVAGTHPIAELWLGRPLSEEENSLMAQSG